MSKNRENVIWQSANGTWSRGFFECYSVGDTSDPDYDDEWDVDYDMGVFTWVSTGHATEQAARASWQGANPGGYNLLSHTTDTVKEAAEYDTMAATLKAEQRAARTARPVSRPAWGW